MNEKRRHERAESGITLIELLVVIAILGILIAIFGGGYMKRLASSKTKLASISMAELGKAIETFEIEEGRLPETLQELRDPPSGAEFAYWKKDFKDPWQHEYEYELDDVGGYRLVSYGSDGLEGGSGSAEDIFYPPTDQDEGGDF